MATRSSEFRIEDYSLATPLARWLAKALSDSGRSRYDVSKRSGVSPARISQILNRPAIGGEKSKTDTITALARATIPETADEIAVLHHINAGLVANGDLPLPVPGGSLVIVREGESPVYRAGAPPDQVTALRSGEVVEIYRTESGRRSGTRMELTDELLERIEFEAELKKKRGDSTKVT